MAYSILSKDGRQGNIIHFLADTVNDYPFIIDSCDPGSTITVLDAPKGEKQTVYTKAPSGTWVVTDGKGEAFPANDVEVKVPANDFEIGGTGRPASDFQSNVKVYPTGLVTGTSHYVKDNKLFGGADTNGHFIAFVCQKPEGATKVTLDLTNKREKLEIPEDNTYMFRLDKARTEGKDTATVTFVKGEGETTVASFAFNISKVDFD